MDYQSKYLKYKQKYLALRNNLQKGGIIGKRATYEYDIYKYCNQKLVTFIQKNNDLAGKGGICNFFEGKSYNL